MWTIRGRGQGRVRRNLVHSVQVVVVRGDSLENKGEREGESRGEEEIPPGHHINIDVRGNLDMDE